MAPLNDPDTYLHIAAAGRMFAHVALPLPDPFSRSVRRGSLGEERRRVRVGQAAPAQSCRK